MTENILFAAIIILVALAMIIVTLPSLQNHKKGK